MEAGRPSDRVEKITAIVCLSFLVRCFQDEMRKLAKDISPLARRLTYYVVDLEMKTGAGHAQRYTGG